MSDETTTSEAVQPTTEPAAPAVSAPISDAPVAPPVAEVEVQPEANDPGAQVPAPARREPVEYHRKFVNGEHSLEVGGKWYPLTGDQPEHLSYLAKRGVPVEEACHDIELVLDTPPAPAAE